MDDDTNTYNRIKTTDKAAEKKPAKKKSKKVLIIISIVVGFIALAVGIFYGAYYYYMSKSYSSYEDTIRNYIDIINTQNSKTSAYIKGNSINADSAKKGLPGIIDKLTSVRDGLNSSTPPDKFRSLCNNLSNGLDNNISMYREINDMLNSSNYDNTDLTSLSKYRDDCMSYYSNISYKDITVDLTDDSITFVNNAVKYFTDQYNAKQQSEITQSQNTDYINSMDTIINSFTSLKTDFSTLAANARNGSDTYDNVLSLIDKNSSAIDALKQNLSRLTLPSDKASAANDAVSKALDDYTTYLQNFKYALTNEKAQAAAQSGPIDSTTLDQFYADANSSFATFNTDFNNMIKAYSDYKTATAAQ